MPHSVPEEFASDYYLVTVNGQAVPVFHAGLNVYFASFDFKGQANVTVTPKLDDDKYAGQTSNKQAAAVEAKGYWRGEVNLRPLSKNIQINLPDWTNPKVIHLKAGIHQQHIYSGSVQVENGKCLPLK